MAGPAHSLHVWRWAFRLLFGLMILAGIPAIHRGRRRWIPATLIVIAALIVWNDLWLKRHHPGLVSGKLSDIGLCVFLPLFAAAALEWFAVACRRSIQANALACAATGIYFSAVKLWPAATRAHVEWLSIVMPRWHFRAVTDPTDLVCLPAIMIAWWVMRRKT